MNALTTRRTILDLIEEYEEKSVNAEHAISLLEEACTAIEMAGTVMGTYVEPIIRHRPHVYPDAFRRNLLKSAWKAIYDRLSIELIASAKDKRMFEQAMADPPPLTYETAKATFGPYLENPRHHILRGLAETFSGLDPAYRSHSKVKIGVAGLPKRVVIQNVAGYGSYGREKLRDVLNALAAVKGEPLVEHSELGVVDELYSYVEAKAGEVTIRGQKIRKFKNGNAHLFFSPDALLEINRGLAEFYGDVLPDVEEEDSKPFPSTDVARDLQFYRSPVKVIEKALNFADVPDLRGCPTGLKEPFRVLEPSCGDGRIMDAIRTYGHRVTGFEYHAGRAAVASANGHSVVRANFLDAPSNPVFDRVVMNPPFYGRHYVKHVRHALNFLKPSGILVAILPATAHYDHDEIKGEWQDLPVASFAEAGTNVPTGLMKIRKPA